MSMSSSTFLLFSALFLCILFCHLAPFKLNISYMIFFLLLLIILFGQPIFLNIFMFPTLFIPKLS
jgi:uncharacterized membrane protein YjjP (DUF1212 family)